MSQPAAAGSQTHRDMASLIKLVKSVLPIVSTTGVTQTGSDVDLKSSESATVIVEVGAVGDTPLSGSKKYTVTVDEADDDGTGSAGSYTTVAAANMIDPDAVLTSGALVINADSLCSAVYRFGLIGVKRHVRVIVTPTGTLTSGTPLSASILRGGLRVLPPA